jgi:hypothetical protein
MTPAAARTGGARRPVRDRQVGGAAMLDDGSRVPVRVPSGVQPPPPPAPRWDPGARYRPSLLARTRGLPGRASRGPGVRTSVRDRDARATAVSGAAERYRRGLLDTSGPAQAVGQVLAPEARPTTADGSGAARS